MGTDILFENHSIKEIQEIEKKLRNDIEKKKEELRQMVGERYRDLMEAADTITEMKEIAESVNICVQSIESGCHVLKGGNFQHGILSSVQDAVIEKKRANELLYQVASQIKILMDSPTQIWSCIEGKNFSGALSLYLLARHVHSTLLLDPLYQHHNISTLFPVVNKQWTSVNSFRLVLLQNYQEVLNSQDAEPEDVVGLLCCSCFLSNKSLDDVLKEILGVKKKLIKSIFRPEKYAKVQLCEFVTTVQMTLKVIFVLFYPDEEAATFSDFKVNLLYTNLMKLINIETPGPMALIDLKSSEVFRFLPTNIKDFRPVLTSEVNVFEIDRLQSECNRWLSELKEMFQSELKNLLNFVNSVHNLALIREAIHEKLSMIDHWDTICANLLKRQFSIWEFFLKDCFLKRIEEIIDEGVKSASEFCQKDIEKAMSEFESVKESGSCGEEDNMLYVWKESDSDMCENIAWIPRHHRNFWSSGELSMKTMGFTPITQRICKDLDSRLENMLVDVSSFFLLSSQEESRAKTAYSQTLVSDLTKDTDVIYEFIYKSSEKYLSNLSSFIEMTLLHLEKEKNCEKNNQRAVFLGHTTNSIANLCPHINVALGSTKLSEIVEKSRRRESQIQFTSGFIKENEAWKDLRKKLFELSASAFRLWSSYQIEQVIEELESEFTVDTPDGILKVLLQWDKTEIQEESEQGNAVQSILRIPQHISTPVSNMLYSFCCKLNSVGGYSINSDIRSKMSNELLAKLLNVYKSKTVVGDMHPRLQQVQALQLMFDVQTLSSLMSSSKDDKSRSAVMDIVAETSSRVDPFDMDVFATPLQQNVKKAVQKSMSLFGLLVSQDQTTLMSGSRTQSSVGGHMGHNVLLTSNSGSRFPLLPLPARPCASNTEQFAAQSKEPSLPAHGSSPNLGELPVNHMGQKSTSFYDRVTAMSSSWFGN